MRMRCRGSLQGCWSRGRGAYSGADAEKQGSRNRTRESDAARVYALHGALWREICPGKLRLQRGDARLECFILLTGEPGHVLDGLEFLTLNDVEVAQNAFGLAAKQRLELSAHPLRHPGGVVHQPCRLIEEPVRRLHHDRLQKLRGKRPLPPRLPCPQTMAMVRRARKGTARPFESRQCSFCRSFLFPASIPS